MNNLQILAFEADSWCDFHYPGDYPFYDIRWEEKYAELIVKACADYIRKNLDSEQAEQLAFCMERDLVYTEIMPNE